jgi:hypothetical protein
MRAVFAEVVAALPAFLLPALIVSMAMGGDSVRMGTIFILRGAPPAPPLFADSDGDCLADDWETLHFGCLDRSGGDDDDGDGADNLSEFRSGTDPSSADTDADGLADGTDPNPLVFDAEGWGGTSLPILDDILSLTGLVVFRP